MRKTITAIALGLTLATGTVAQSNAATTTHKAPVTVTHKVAHKAIPGCDYEDGGRQYPCMFDGGLYVDLHQACIDWDYPQWGLGKTIRIYRDGKAEDFCSFE